jgi:hypothetical protein
LAQEKTTCQAEIDHLHRTRQLAAEQKTRLSDLKKEVIRLNEVLGPLSEDIADKENLIKVLQSNWTLNNCGGVAKKKPPSKKLRSTGVIRDGLV